jgi:hypothetical protein
MNKKIIIGVAGALVAVAMAGGIAALVIRAKKQIKVGDTVSFGFAAAALDPTLCVKANDPLVFTGVVASVASAGIAVTWNTIVNPKASGSSVVSGSTCTDGAVLTLERAKSTDPTILFGSATVKPTNAALANVPLIIAADALTKL